MSGIKKSLLIKLDLYAGIFTSFYLPVSGACNTSKRIRDTDTDGQNSSGRFRIALRRHNDEGVHPYRIPALGVDLNEEVIKKHLREGDKYFAPTAERDKDRSWDRTWS